MLLFVPPEKQKNVRERLNKLIYVPFKFEFSGSRIIFFDREEGLSDLGEERDTQPTRAFRELTDGHGEQDI